MSQLLKLLLFLLRLPLKLIGYIAMKRRARMSSEQLLQHAEPPKLHKEYVRELRQGWTAQAKQLKGRQGENSRAQEYTKEECALIHRIHHETEQANRNNVTRTEAYRSIYFRCQELHWALLAHVVSRNGGWNMTDLQGDLLPRLLDDGQREETFLLLERVNSLIFHDAYPQLLLYEASCKAGRELFDLLPAFQVSVFMKPVWSQFWKRRDPALLTTALIVNEQHVIEEPIVQSPFFKEHVLNQLSFQLQSPMQTNAVFMPYCTPDRVEKKLAGLIIENFCDLQERIEFGKRMYAILFGVPEVRAGVHAFVRAVPHTGSRADYAPQLFTKEHDAVASLDKYTEKLDGCELRAGASKLTSLVLSSAWEDIPFEAPDREDWFISLNEKDRLNQYFAELPLPGVFDMTEEHYYALNKIELAVLAAEGLQVAFHERRKGDKTC
ncbi:uncharacterized protein DUF2515 [Paenibacillus taihuensis]|uniref:Uncharacterized protein DUF2515 n=1 Tax=Paenibacillus taihuensis TaxID=1156355 RepID=A0A3D9S6K6_9BACL|nr:DUF2515 family protein [Paenibacillus taihuensis]REE88614.1 uncharacterized protein DUF2515 [Paenibacillus taihuensis]